MLNDKQKRFISHLSKHLPDRRRGKRGPHPIDKETLITELFILFRTNCGWRNIAHPTTARNYLHELQRRSKFKDFFNFLTSEYTRFKPKKVTVDTSDIESYRTNGLVAYSGKYHNYCIKMAVGITPEYIPVYFSVDKGTKPDSAVLDEILCTVGKLPHELFLDMGFEKYERRRTLQKQGCQVRLEMKNYSNNRKRGRRFVFTDGHKSLRGEIEKVFGWLKAFLAVKFNRLRIKALIHAMFIFCLSYVTFIRIWKF